MAKIVAPLPSNLSGTRDKAIMLLGWAGAFRRSELTNLDAEDIRFTSREMVVTLRFSKTDQEGRGTKKRIPMLDDETLCPVRALKAWMNAASIKRGPLFRPVDRWGHVRRGRMTNQSVALVVKHVAKVAGLDPRQFAGHSLRSGFATQAATDLVPEWSIAEMTGHKSREVLGRYIRDAGLGQMSAIRRAFGETNHFIS